MKISVYWGKCFYFDQVFDRYCNGISGALVEVWYAGGEPGCGEYFTLNSEHPKSESFCSFSGNVGYTFPRRDPELWYRGKVNGDSQGRYFKTTINIDFTYLFYVHRYQFKATYPRKYDGRPIIHYHYKVKKRITFKLYFGTIVFLLVFRAPMLIH